MALFLADGFDLYTAGNTNDPWTIGPWTGQSNTQYGVSTSTRFGAGKSFCAGVNYNQDRNLYKSLGANTTNTIYFSAAMSPGMALTGGTELDGYIQFTQGGTEQLYFAFAHDGALRIYRNGTLIATWTAAFTYTWFHLQIKIVIDPTVGEIRIRKNGDTSDTFVATGLNTRATANAYIDTFKIGGGNGSQNGGFYFDDVLLFDSSGTSFNTWQGDVRCYTLLPSAAGSVANFTAPSALTTLVNTPANYGTRFHGANEIELGTFVPTVGGSLSKVTLALSGGITGTMNASLYADSAAPAGTPGTLIATATAVTNPAGGAVDFVFSSPPTVTANTRYWVGINSSAGWNYYWSDNTKYIAGSVTYGTWSSTVSSYSAGSGYLFYYTVSSIPSYSGLAVYDGDSSVTTSATLNNHDLLAMSDLPVTPTTILAVIPRVAARKSDAGTRALQPEIKSGATTAQGTASTLSGSFGNVSAVWVTDPNTSAAWTASAVNALEVGYKIST